MALPELNFTRDWTNHRDFPTYVDKEETVRGDFQALHNETRDFLNTKLTPAVEAELRAQQQAIGDRVTHEELAELAQGQIPDGTLTSEKFTPELKRELLTDEVLEAWADGDAVKLKTLAGRTKWPTSLAKLIQTEKGATVEQVLAALRDPVGTIRRTVSSTPTDDTWLPCDGRLADPELHPELYEMLPRAQKWIQGSTLEGVVPMGTVEKFGDWYAVPAWAEVGTRTYRYCVARTHDPASSWEVADIVSSASTAPDSMDIVFDGTTWVVVIDDAIYTADNPAGPWSESSTGIALDTDSVVTYRLRFADGYFVRPDGTSDSVTYTRDLKNWHQSELLDPAGVVVNPILHDVQYCDGVWVAFATAGRKLYRYESAAPDTSWTLAGGAAGYELQSGTSANADIITLRLAGDKYVLGCEGGVLYFADDPRGKFQRVDTGSDRYDIYQVAYSDGFYVLRAVLNSSDSYRQQLLRARELSGPFETVYSGDLSSTAGSLAAFGPMFVLIENTRTVVTSQVCLPELTESGTYYYIKGVQE